MHLVLISAIIAAMPMAPRSTVRPPIRILVLPSPSVADTAGLITALRIQLGQRATVTAGPAVEGETSTARASSAVARAGDVGATMSLWRERRTTSSEPRHDYVLHVVTSDGGAIRHRTFPLTSVHAGPDTDRALALKVATILDNDDSVARTQAPPKGAKDNGSLVHRPKRPWRPWLGGGATGAVGNGSPSAQLSVGIRGGVARGDIRQAALYIAAYVDRGVEDTGDAGELSTRELHADVGATVLRRVGRAVVGADLKLGTRAIRARGVTAAGTEGITWVFVPRAVASAVSGWQLSPRLGLRVELGAEVLTRRRRFAVNNQVLVDVGRARMHLGIFLVFPVR